MARFLASFSPWFALFFALVLLVRAYCTPYLYSCRMRISFFPGLRWGGTMLSFPRSFYLRGPVQQAKTNEPSYYLHIYFTTSLVNLRSQLVRTVSMAGTFEGFDINEPIQADDSDDLSDSEYTAIGDSEYTASGESEDCERERRARARRERARAASRSEHGDEQRARRPATCVQR